MRQMEIIEDVCRSFGIEGNFVGYKEIKNGNVNKTYSVYFTQGDEGPTSYLLQAVNTFVFRNPVQVMENIEKITAHINSKKAGQTALHFHQTAERCTFIEIGNEFWRLCNHIPSITFNACSDLEVVRNAGAAFGEFQMLLSDFDASRLHYTIPDFHNTKKRYEKLLADVSADPCDKVKEVQDDLWYLFSVHDLACTLTDMHEQGKLPLRVTHNDTKINNVLFDPVDKHAIAVIDLDTVMPGLVGHDFGDAIRFAANYVEEDSKDHEKAGCDMEVFRAFTEGFLKETIHMLTKDEIDTLALSGFVIAAELASRFLDDYILGSPYFKTDYPEHNLVRTRCQIALAKDFQKKLPEMESIVKECAERYR